MGLYNTPRMTETDVARMNTSFRAIGLVTNPTPGIISSAEINELPGEVPFKMGLAKFFRVTPASVRNWLNIPQSTSSRNFVRAVDFPNSTMQIGAVGRRVYCLSESQRGYLPAMKALLTRIILAVCLQPPGSDASAEGLRRAPIYTGVKAALPPRTFPRLSSAITYIWGIWAGDTATNNTFGIDPSATFFLERAWTHFRIFVSQDTQGAVIGWTVWVNYNNCTQAQGSDPDVDLFPDERRIGQKPCP